MRAIRLSVTDLTDFGCERHNTLSILREMRGIPKAQVLNRYIVAGNILHSIMQETLLRKFSYVEYYHSRHGRGPEESLRIAFDRILEHLQNLYLSSRHSVVLYPEILSSALDMVQQQLPSLASLCTKVVYETPKGLWTSAVADEFTLQTVIDDFLLLVGHVDLACLEEGRMKLIELKTGNEYASDASQAQLYGELFSLRNSEDSFSIDIWYSKSGETKTVSRPRTSLLDRIRDSITLARSIAGESDLPPKRRPSKCQYCELCGLIPDLFDHR